ncbi:MAG TPA: pyridoxal 5'-phosphate synthase glutaminase subunit PdxT [Planctomycetota bacterium]|nr:pyridoxal 5'-phosphate synthase glutaminase subunit PdxT [Planctomycetota bacterium]
MKRAGGLTVGVLALQGDFAAHERAVAALGHRSRQVRTAAQLQGLDALLLPGGESTTMLKLLQGEGLLAPLAAFCRSGLPVFGTCAGAILLASEVASPAQASLGVLDIAVQRNAYGRQIDAGGVQRRCRRREVLPHDCRVAHLAVAQSQFVMGKADGPGIVRAFGEAQGLGEERNAA